jgi:hypothetical protein
MSTVGSLTPASETWPVWQDFVDNWRAVDAHWFRARVVNMFDSATARTNAAMTPLAGSLSYLQDIDSLEMYKSSGAWESVRYPNLTVSSDSTTITLRRTGAGSGLVLDNTGYANIEKLNAGLGVLNVISTGATFKTGTKAVTLTTDTAQLLIDSPVRITGALSTTGALSAPSLALTGALTSATVTATGQVQGATVVATGQSSGVSGLFGTIALVSSISSEASLAHNSATTSGFRAASNGSTNIIGTSIGLTGAVTASAAVTVNGVLTMSGGGKIQSGVDVAGLVVSTVAPGAGDTQPNGTIWIVR